MPQVRTFSRSGTLFGALAACLVLASCTATPTSGNSTTATASPSTSASAVSLDSLPTVEGYKAVGAIKTLPRTNPWDGLVSDGKAVMVYHNDLKENSFNIVGYSASGYTQTWKDSGDGLLTCESGEPVVCQEIAYTQGDYIAREARIISVDSGTTTKLRVGAAGTFTYVGTHKDNAYFLTWDGTDTVHLTGFDGTGTPVRDTNLKIDAPQERNATDVSAQDLGEFARLSVPGSEALLFSFEKNSVVAGGVPSTCVAIGNGVLCGDDAGLVVGFNSAGEAWEVENGTGHLLAASPSSTVSLSKAKATLQDIPPAFDAVSESYALVTPTAIEVATVENGTLSLADGRKIPISNATLTGVDLTHPEAIIDLRTAGAEVGETGGHTLDTSVIVSSDGSIIAKLDETRAKGLLSDAGNDVVELYPYSFQRSGKLVIFSDGVDGIVGIYRAA